MAVLSEEQERRYRAAAHAVQSGVAADQSLGSDDGSPKHLRVGINVALVEVSVLMELMIEKGLITTDELGEALTKGMEKEAKRYEAHLKEQYGLDVTLG